MLLEPSGIAYLFFTIFSVSRYSFFASHSPAYCCVVLIISIVVPLLTLVKSPSRMAKLHLQSFHYVFASPNLAPMSPFLVCNLYSSDFGFIVALDPLLLSLSPTTKQERNCGAPTLA
ncbi:hypothetical protein PHYBLDRAFT_140620 [Phycomyces blakesleeanus NRRL 1555(-)]|uniref:Uncharacterized protein n=1 Tax=Phycomyces blakesleeanus (strain ATCC 8743b / DSM 1359 / FGSC 10004 / NBRC 33097 / NRRL 1555) TaxID=763407 RepID=A0A163EGQ6_PHYB8|nr:hypothetical protein PHYBLDRAFT_140620 [Phycomyces blakesleeanus NRRL 1555(-)]OAD78550.1 hypothetical protein PHYBLDRAFT_140620 [Phycomyces blakesleeanus NRRL 1555(-)]|eukprot:XP_018296590.1 hypothetical protein PHYBLDRAFT_140620 [Phycomyces blakesleeanus NRRL 1555(-)]